MTPMRLLFAAQGYPGVPGTGSGSGIGTYVRELTLGLTAGGHECHVMVWSEGGDGKVVVDGVTIHFVSRRYWPVLERWWPESRNVQNRARIAAGLDRKHRFDWIEIESDEGIDVGVQRRFGTRVILRVHTTLAQMCREKNVPGTGRTAAYLARERRSFRLAKRVLVSSPAHAAELVRDHPELPPAEIIPIGWGEGNREPRIESPTERPVFLYVGSLDRRKGIDRLAPILSKYADRHGRCELRIVSSSHSNTIREFGLDRLLPDVALSCRSGLTTEELVAEYCGAAALIHPARYESFGLPLIEAASVGTPVVAANTGIAPILCAGTLSPFLVDMDQPVNVSAALRRAVDTRRATGLEFYRSYAANFTRHQMVERYTRLLLKWEKENESSRPPSHHN